MNHLFMPPSNPQMISKQSTDTSTIYFSWVNPCRTLDPTSWNRDPSPHSPFLDIISHPPMAHLPHYFDSTGSLWDAILSPGLALSESTAVREELFGLLTAAWQLKPAMWPRLRPASLVFLGDAFAPLRKKALEFWHRELPKEVPARLQALLQDSLACAGQQWVRHRADFLR